MANRTHPLIIKVRKQKRMRRAYLRPFNDIKVPRRISTNTPEPSDDGLNYEDMYKYRTRGSTFWDDFFTTNMPTMLSKGRLAVIARAKELTRDISPECNVIVQRGGITRTITRFYFATDFSLCFFMKEDWRSMFMVKSSPYAGSGCRERAMFDFENNRLTWVERIEFPTIYPDPPPDN